MSCRQIEPPELMQACHRDVKRTIAQSDVPGRAQRCLRTCTAFAVHGRLRSRSRDCADHFRSEIDCPDRMVLRVGYEQRCAE